MAELRWQIEFQIELLVELQNRTGVEGEPDRRFQAHC